MGRVAIGIWGPMARSSWAAGLWEISPDVRGGTVFPIKLLLFDIEAPRGKEVPSSKSVYIHQSLEGVSSCHDT